MKKLKKGSDIIIQFDGPNDSDSDEEEDDEDFDNIPVASLSGGADMEEDEGPVCLKQFVLYYFVDVYN